jgi:hypothetical protein
VRADGFGLAHNFGGDFRDGDIFGDWDGLGDVVGGWDWKRSDKELIALTWMLLSEPTQHTLSSLSDVGLNGGGAGDWPVCSVDHGQGMRIWDDGLVGSDDSLASTAGVAICHPRHRRTIAWKRGGHAGHGSEGGDVLHGCCEKFCYFFRIESR